MEEIIARPMISSVAHYSSKLILSISYNYYMIYIILLSCHARSHVHIISFAIMVSLCSCCMIVMYCHVHYWLCGKILSNPKQPSCKKKCAALRKAMVKKDVKSKVAAKKWL